MSKLLRYILFMFSFALFFIGKFYSYNVMLIGVLTLWSHNVIYSFEKIKLRIFFLVFNLVIFFFLIGRPTISMIRGNVWWYYSFESVHFALNSLMLTLICLFIGEYLFEHVLIKHVHTEFKVPVVCRSDFIFALRNISLMFFYLSCIFTFMMETEKLLYMRGKDYLEFYTSFKTSLPYVVIGIGSMYKYFLCMFLSTWPKKSTAFFALMVYIFLAVPDLLIGVRNPIVLNVIFVLLYYFIRDVIGDKEKWLGFLEKMLVVLLTPIATIVLGALNYIRNNEGSSEVIKNFFDLIVDFIYKQGVSFEVLCIGYESIPKIKYTGFTNYTFGGIIDYFKYGTISQMLWGGVSLENGNNLNRALYSNSFSHRMSYVAMGQEYLNGHGLGSSYILETFADFGYLGVTIFSILMGAFLASMIYVIRNGNIGFILVLTSLTSIYFCPRNFALGWINFIFYLQFWIPFLACYISAKLCIKKHDYVNLRYINPSGVNL